MCGPLKVKSIFIVSTFFSVFNVVYIMNEKRLRNRYVVAQRRKQFHSWHCKRQNAVNAGFIRPQFSSNSVYRSTNALNIICILRAKHWIPALIAGGGLASGPARNVLTELSKTFQDQVSNFLEVVYFLSDSWTRRMETNSIWMSSLLQSAVRQ